MTEHPGWPLFVDYLSALSASTQRYVLEGKCKSSEDYKWETGKIAGLQLALEAPVRLAQSVQHKLEQAEQDRMFAGTSLQ